MLCAARSDAATLAGAGCIPISRGLVMARRERAKGVRGEREVLELLRARGFEVRGLEATGDHLAFLDGLVFHVETKRQETARPWAWLEQAENETPRGAITLVAFRRSRSKWYALVPLEPLADALGRKAGA
jgi:Holliday junction resolvase